jgi:hypothetical protein
MSFDASTFTPDPSLERPHYVRLSFQQLSELHDTESLFMRGVRLFFGVSMQRNIEEAESLFAAAAQQGHPLAIAFCLSPISRFPHKSVNRSVELLAQSAARNHPVGNIPSFFDFFRFSS